MTRFFAMLKASTGLDPGMTLHFLNGRGIKRRNAFKGGSPQYPAESPSNAPRTDARNERQLVLKTNRTSAMSNQLVTSDPEILGGTPVFAGTRVPLAVLFENLADGLSLDEILESYPTLKRAQVIEALHQAESLLELAKAA